MDGVCNQQCGHHEHLGKGITHFRLVCSSIQIGNCEGEYMNFVVINKLQ